MKSITTTVNDQNRPRFPILAGVIKAASFCFVLGCGAVSADVAHNSKIDSHRVSLNSNRTFSFDTSFDAIRVAKPRIIPDLTGFDPPGASPPPIRLILSASSMSATDEDGCGGSASETCTVTTAANLGKSGFYIQEFSMFYVVGSGIRLPDDAKEF